MFDELKRQKILNLKAGTKKEQFIKQIKVDLLDRQKGINEYAELYNIARSSLWIIFNSNDELKYSKPSLDSWDYRIQLFKSIPIGTKFDQLNEIISPYKIDNQEGETKFAYLIKLQEKQYWYIFNEKNELIEIKESRIRSVNDIQVMLYKLTSPNFLIKEPIVIEDGNGCGIWGQKGKPEPAMNKLKFEASSKNYDAVLIETIIEPHLNQTVTVYDNRVNSNDCFDNRYIIKAFGLRKKVID